MSNTIRDRTKDLHDEVENLPFTRAMIEGKHKPHERSAWLMSQFQAFKVLDDHVPLVLKRALILKNDIVKLPLSVPAVASNSYARYLTNVQNPNPHIYLNYMGLLFGGQILKKFYPTSSSVYEFDQSINELRDMIRSNYVQDTDEYIEEVKTGFRYQIKIASELGFRYGY